MLNSVTKTSRVKGTYSIKILKVNTVFFIFIYFKDILQCLKSNEQSIGLPMDVGLRHSSHLPSHCSRNRHISPRSDVAPRIYTGRIHSHSGWHLSI